MEVHHHMHAPKKWKEYITEFVMLFAAVTLGFIAENQREHVVERHRAEELSQALLKDLEIDAIEFDSFLNQRAEDRKSYQTAIQLIDERGVNPRDSVLYYHFMKGIFVWRYAEFRQANLDQIISSGSLRYFKNEELIQAVSDLKLALKRVEFRQDREKNYFYDYVQPFVSDHVNLVYSDSIRLGVPRAVVLQRIQQNPSSISRKDFFFNLKEPGIDQKTVNTIRNMDYLISVTKSGYYAKYQKAAKHLIELLKNNFNNQ
jgi:hypothetical protein